MALRQVFAVEAVGDTNVVAFTHAILDTQAAQAVAEGLSRLVAEPGRPNLLLDLGNVEFLTAAWLGKLVALNRTAQAAGGRLTLINVTPLLYEIFAVTHLTQVLDLRPASDPSILVGASVP